LATSLDGRIATASGESKWITGEAARAEGNWLRDRHAAILVGVETVLADDPALTFRHPGGRAAWYDADDQPLRVILDSRLRTPPDAQVASGNTLIVTAVEPRPVGHAEVTRVASIDGRPS